MLGTEVFGIDDDLLSYEGIPCVIRAARQRQALQQVSHLLLLLDLR
jgi:hypothetical protein